jgi:glycosyltransferase involved in cell wall biosynthesis
LGIKTVLSYDHYFFRRGKATPLFFPIKKALQAFDYLLPVSQYCLKQSVDYWGITSPVQVLYNGVNVDQFRPSDDLSNVMRARLGLGTAPVLLYVGRVCEQKGTDTLLEAYSQLRRRHALLRLVIAGPAERFGNSGETTLTRRIRESGGLYLGPVSELDLPAIYNMCNVFVMPTRSLEMFGMAALEAQACGKPVVCTLHGGLPEVISKDSGLFFAPGDADALTEQIDLLLSDATMREQMCVSARENSKRFEWKHLVRQLAEVYAAG